jgi:hypothetical protein
VALATIAMTAAVGCRHGNRPPATIEDDRPDVSAITRRARSDGAARTQPGEAPAAQSAEGLNVVRTYLDKPCRVQFRRDALGLAAPAPLSPTSERVGMNFAVLGGTLERVTDAGVLLRTGDGPKWIPWPSILLIELQDHP